MNRTRIKTQALVIGSGLAGCTSALYLADLGIEVTLISSGSCNTALAQGGVVFKSSDDTPKLLEKDIMAAGWDFNFRKAVIYLCKKGPSILQEFLIDKMDIPFEAENDVCKLTKEGGHSVPRILYCADYTGKAIMEKIMSSVRNHPNITLLNQRTAVDLLTIHHHSTRMEYKYHLTNRCVGAYVLNEQSREVETFLADFTVLATGGIGQIYLHTTNTDSSIGSGLSMANRSGAKIMNSEFIQFHPTALLHRAHRKFLISEAVRGEGAQLINSKNQAFMSKYDPRAELAPRDIVTRAIVEEMLKTGDDCVYLDATNLKEDIRRRFPTIYTQCVKIGIDPAREHIPVVPAAHYFCGGILVDTNGRSTLEGLYAAGECSCSGVHGANRLASTSLLECIVWGWSVAKDIHRRMGKKAKLSHKLEQAIPNWVSPGQNMNEDPALIAQDWATIRHTMWNYVGITRTTSRLKRAFEDMRGLNKRMHDFYKETPISKPLVDLFHGCQTAYAVTTSALRNKKSLGCHYRVN